MVADMSSVGQAKCWLRAERIGKRSTGHAEARDRGVIREIMEKISASSVCQQDRGGRVEQTLVLHLVELIVLPLPFIGQFAGNVLIDAIGASPPKGLRFLARVMGYKVL